MCNKWCGCVSYVSHGLRQGLVEMTGKHGSISLCHPFGEINKKGREFLDMNSSMRCVLYLNL